MDYVTSSGVHTYLKYKPWKGGEHARSYTGHYDYRTGLLELDFSPAAGSYLVVRYLASRMIPPFDAARVDITREHAELIVLYACGKALVRVEGQDANLSRWKDEPGRRDDNPMINPSTRYFQAYKGKINALLNKPRFLRRSRV